jgi:hypothetical protein
MDLLHVRRAMQQQQQQRRVESGANGGSAQKLLDNDLGCAFGSVPLGAFGGGGFQSADDQLRMALGGGTCSSSSSSSASSLSSFISARSLSRPVAADRRNVCGNVLRRRTAGRSSAQRSSIAKRRR